MVTAAAGSSASGSTWPTPSTCAGHQKRWHEHRAHEQRVEQHSQAHDEAYLRERDEREYAEHREHRREQDSCARDHATCRTKSGEHAVSRGRVHRLLTSPGRKEDVVVDAERDEEQERQQQHAGVERRVVEHVLEDPPRRSERGEERAEHGGHEQHRREQRPQQEHEHGEHDHEHDRDHDLRVPERGVLGIEASRRVTADDCVGAWHRSHRRAQVADLLVGRFAPGLGREDDGDLGDVSSTRPRGRGHDARRGLGCRDHGVHRRGVGHHDRRRGHTRGEHLGERLRPEHCLGLHAELLVLAQPDLYADAAEREDEQHQRRADPHDVGTAAYELADAAPELALARLVAHARDERPEQPAAEHHHRGRKHEESEHHGDDDADSRREPDTAQALALREQQREQGEGDGSRRCQDRLRRTVQCHLHRVEARVL